MVKKVKYYDDIINNLSREVNETFPKTKKSINTNDEHLNELSQLKQIPKKEKGYNMAHTQVFKEGLINEADVLYLPKDGKYAFALVVVDSSSKKCDAEPITTVSSSHVVKAFEKIYARGIISYPKVKIIFDSGSEFKGDTNDYFKTINIRRGITSRSRQQSLVETKNRIIGDIIFRMQQLEEIKTNETNTKWTKILPTIIKQINERAIPVKKEISDDVLITKENHNLIPEGTNVRIALDYPVEITGEKIKGSKQFRASDIRWSRKIYKIEHLLLNKGKPPMYLINNNDRVARTALQLQIVN